MPETSPTAPRPRRPGLAGLRRRVSRRLRRTPALPAWAEIPADHPNVDIRLNRSRETFRRLPPVAQRLAARATRQALRFTRPKVSLVIATYNSDPKGLTRVMGSLARQTMRVRDIEVVFVDDGSTDDTRERLALLAAYWPNVHVHAIPNSGWASRPRNVGVRLARGEYVMFMDHDDELFPTGLQRAYDYGRANDADVVNPREVRTRGWSWGWDSFLEDVPLAAPGQVDALIPMTPHKLYRREFVLREGIEFLEGARILWEDIYYNTAMLGHGARVSTWSSTPVYHWVHTGSNTSKTFGRDPREFWSNLRQLFDFFARELDGRPDRWAMTAHQLRARVLKSVGPPSLSRSAEYLDVMHEYVEGIVADYAPPARDAEFDSADRCRLELVRLGRRDLLATLAGCDRGLTALPTVEDVHWEGRHLVVTASATLVDAEGGAVHFVRHGDTWRRDLPAELTDVLSDAALDLGPDLARAVFRLSVKGRASHSGWPLGEPGTVRMEETGDGRAVVRATASARFDPAAFAAEHDLDDTLWDFSARLTAFGLGAHRGLYGGETRAALVDDAVAIAYRNQSDILSLDCDGNTRSVTGAVPPRVEDVELAVRPAAGGGVRVDLRVPLRDAVVVGPGRLEGRLHVGEHRLPATLRGEDGLLVLRAEGEVPAGEHVLMARFQGRTGDTGLVLAVGDGAARVRPAAAPA